MKRGNNNILTNLLLSLLVVVLMASCNNNANHRELEGKASNDPCIITPKLKKALKNYDVLGYENGDGLITVRSRKPEVDDEGHSYYPTGCMNLEGRLVVPLKYHDISFIYNDSNAHDGVVFVNNGVGKFGLVDLEGNQILPCVYDFISVFYGDFSIVNKDNKYGIVNKKGMEIIPMEYDNISSFYFEKFFSYGCEKYDFESAFYLEKNGETKVVNLSRSDVKFDKTHIETPYDYESLIRNNKYGYVNYLGEEIPCQYQNARRYFSEGLAAVVKNNKVGFIDKDGTVIIPFKFYYAVDLFGLNSNNLGVFSEGVAAMANNNLKWGFIDKQGNTMIPFVYDWADCFHHGSAIVGKLVGKEMRYGIVDKSNSVVLPFEYEHAVYSGNVFVMCKNGKWGLFSSMGNWLATCQYDQHIVFTAGYATVESNGKRGLVDEQGQLLIPCEYESASYDWQSDLVWVKQNGKYGYVDLNNRVVVPIKYDEAESFKPVFRVMEKDRDGRLKFGLYDRCGNCTLD